MGTCFAEGDRKHMEHSNRLGANRRFRLFLASTVIACSVLSSGALAGQPGLYDLGDLKALERAFTKLADKVRPSVVAIRTYQASNSNSRAGRSVLRPDSQGTGFIIDPAGYIVTNRHVIEDANVVSVILDNGVKYDAEIVQADIRSDIAVLKIEAKGLKAVRLGDGGKLRPNQWVFASGNPFGLALADGRPSVSYGVVSAVGRQMTQRLVGNSNIQYYGNMIETSATINPGNSGGALFDIDGNAVGIVTAIETGSGLSEGRGFAIPMDRNIRRIIETLKSGEEVRYGYLGVTVQDVEKPVTSLVVDSRTYRGALLKTINPTDGPAGVAGLRADDIVIEFDGAPIENSDHLVRLVGFTPVGTDVSVTFLRGRVKRKTTVTLGDRMNMIGRAARRP